MQVAGKAQLYCLFFEEICIPARPKHNLRFEEYMHKFPAFGPQSEHQRLVEEHLESCRNKWGKTLQEWWARAERAATDLTTGKLEINDKTAVNFAIYRASVRLTPNKLVAASLAARWEKTKRQGGRIEDEPLPKYPRGAFRRDEGATPSDSEWVLFLMLNFALGRDQVKWGSALVFSVLKNIQEESEDRYMTRMNLTTIKSLMKVREEYREYDF